MNELVATLNKRGVARIGTVGVGSYAGASRSGSFALGVEYERCNGDTRIVATRA